MKARLWMVLLAAAFDAVAARAQDWNAARTLDLVRRATDRRVLQLADSGLVDYQATAHGYVTFLTQLGEALRMPPRVVKADELALEVYWRAPNLSKQRIIGRRDTTVLPTDIEYHRDHLGIVQNNFPAIIRIGDGIEVRDVPHPLSPAGMLTYQFALTDSLRLSIPGRVMDMYEVKVRPLDERRPGVVGAIYIEREQAQVVRMAFGFTRASYLDKQLEELFVVLENGLIGDRFWLPRRQEIEIRRSVSWMDYPVRGIIRGRWEIGDYRINQSVPVSRFYGTEIEIARPEQLRAYQWPPGRLVDSIPPESRLPTPTEVQRIQAEARSLVVGQALRSSRLALAGRGVSDFARFDRNSGLSLGTGFSARLGRGWSTDARVRYGVDDERARGRFEAGWDSERVGVAGHVADDVRDAGHVAERSTLVNSIAAQEFGSDVTDAFAVRSIGLALSFTDRSRRLWTLGAAAERQAPLAVSARTFRGAFRTAFDAAQVVGRSVQLTVAAPPFDGSLGTTRQYTLGGGVTAGGSARYAATLDVGKQFGDARLLTRTIAGAVDARGRVNSQDLVILGGPVSAPGFDVHALVGDRALSQLLEFHMPVPFPGARLGRFGRIPARVVLAPHWGAVGLHAVEPGTIIRRSGAGPDPFRSRPTGWYHSAGVSLLALFEFVRLDVSREMPNGRWRFSIDANRAYWSIL